MAGMPSWNSGMRLSTSPSAPGAGVKPRIVRYEGEIKARPWDETILRKAKRKGFSDRAIAWLWKCTEREVYEKRRESYAGKIRGMVRYVEDRERCRQLQLMEYFGQRETEPCGICDNCLARRKGRRQDGREAARAKVLEVLGREELEMHELAARLDFPREVVTAVTRELLDEGAIRYLDDMKLTSRKNK